MQTRACALVENQFDHGCIHFVCLLAQCNLIASKTPHPGHMHTSFPVNILCGVRNHVIFTSSKTRARIKTLIWACAFNEARKLHFLYCIYIKSYKISTPASTIFLCAHTYLSILTIIWIYSWWECLWFVHRRVSNKKYILIKFKYFVINVRFNLYRLKKN